MYGELYLIKEMYIIRIYIYINILIKTKSLIELVYSIH